MDREVSTIDPAEFKPMRAVTKIDPKEFKPATPTPKGTDLAGSVFDNPTVGQRFKRFGRAIGRATVEDVAGGAPIAAGAAAGAGIGALGGPAAPVTVPVGAVIGAIAGGHAAPASVYLANRYALRDKNAQPPSEAEALRSAKAAGLLEMAGPIVSTQAENIAESVLGIRGASQLVREGRANAQGAGEALAQKQGEITSSLATREEQAWAERVGKSIDLSQRQGKAAEDIASNRAAIARKAVAEHADTIKQAQDSADQARVKLRQNIASDVEKARPEAAEQVGNAQAQQMLGKTPPQFSRESAQPYELRAAALSRSSNAYFDAAANFHEEVGAKFEPYIGKIKADPVAPASIENIESTIARVNQTLEERGQRIESAELKKVIDGINGGASAQADREIAGAPARKTATGERAVFLTQAQLKAMQAKLSGEVADEEGGDLTYGKLWGYRARANRVLASAKNPADRAAAREIVGAVNDAIPNIPPEIRSQYAFERKVSRATMGKVAGARNPQEVGEAIFGSKNAPEPAEAALQTIRFTKKYNPEGMDGIRESFADRYFGNKMDANDLGKMNPQILKELYGDKADSVVRLLGPEGDLKQASWGQLIKSDPNARALLEKSIRESATKQANLASREALAEGQKALAELPPKYNYVKQALAQAKTPEAQLKILREQLPEPKDIKPTGPEAKVLAQQPPDVEKAAKRALQKGAPKLEGRMEGYMKRRLAFMVMLAMTGAYGMYAHRPELVTASLIIGAGLGGRGAARYALTTERGADLYMKALDMAPTPENAAAFGQAVMPVLSGAVAAEVRDQTNPR